MNVLNHHLKYPRTPHFVWSGSRTEDDIVTANVDGLINREIVVTEKMDGENTNMYRDHIHARSLDSRSHLSRDWVKNFWASFRHIIPEGWRVCGENVYARHTIAYENLESYFLGFSIWNEKNICLDWDTTLEWFSELGITAVPLLYRGPYDEEILYDLTITEELGESEGYVVRWEDEFSFWSFASYVCKYVRKNHVQTDEHWMYRPVIPNGLRS